MSPDMNEIVRARVGAGLTQAQVAALIGVSLDGYRKWEGGSRAMSSVAWRLMRIMLGLDAEYGSRAIKESE